MVDKSKFKVDERNGEYIVTFGIIGSMTQTITASNPEEATEVAKKMVDLIAENTDAELDTINEVSIEHIYRALPMYFVLRDGKHMKVSHLRDGDVPREPDANGF